MRRTLLVAVITAVVTSGLTTATVGAATSGGDKSPEGADVALPLPTTGSLAIDIDTRVNCGTPRPGKNWPNQDALEDTIRCLEDEIINVNRFMKFFFRCAQPASITQYGENPTGGASGYLFDNGDGVVFLTTGLDATIPGDPFSIAILWRNTSTCFQE